ncbi:MAG: hypothetical protein Q8J64_07375 [Thermodesulfovibrionales bacterium]|nr:hypothetical protein [Thermodesulfovibrionales bacterium]
MDKKVNFSIHSTLPALCMVEPTKREGYLIVARDLLQAVEALSTLQNIPPRGCALIAAHALECALKAFLWDKGKEKVIRKVRHNLVALWNMAYKEKTLNIPEVLPDWCKVLSSGHGPIFYFRYQVGEKDAVVHGGQTPALIPMAGELKKLIEMVEHAIKVKLPKIAGALEH